MSKQLVAIGKDDQLITTCSGCGSTVTLYPHAAVLVRKTGIRPLCTDCRRRLPAKRANGVTP